MRSLWILCFVCAVPGIGSASSIDTYRYWDGEANIYGFGCRAVQGKWITSTYGQVITIPKRTHALDKFSFWWTHHSGGGSMVVRGEVYAWDGEKATGNSLYESAPRSFSFNDGLFHKVTFTPALSVKPGQYVIFASVDKDWEECKKSYMTGWGFVSYSYYPEGRFVYQDNYGDESHWTSERWHDGDGAGNVNLAFKAILSP